MNKIHKQKQIAELFKLLNVEYLTDYKYEFDKIIGIDCYESQYYLDNESEFKSLTIQYGESIKQRDLADIFISKTQNKGYGLFALTSIPENNFIGVYLGIIREEDEMVPFDENGYDTDYAWDFPDEIEGFPALEINAKYSGNELRFANHDLEPNIRVEHTVVNNEWYIFFIADRDISSDEELTICYGEAYWDTDYRALS